ncbi:MAG TPA: multifunctional oxoglutarate decarboxylase/oxoglutarate dehydrogenase thiamine pyrophosphate-binding subunit/dihydrolipoyllysine-residue succinyltransferase subunit [Candidatus Polarisedimenticolaceae bacterium]|nr:multifunctional oxoglutarate decarboxylase/oxoglutarate dehydrogenase thiamine pyrophosphate-binding subunit/dihydrolipoyllysine-residue succinyltransferase subunit [Candidatus Polarisedimenticolaceae bacterium]
MSRFGHNRGYIDELYRSFLDDPTSVSEAWREFFRDYRADGETTRRHDRPATETASPPATDAEPPPTRLVGISARIAENMNTSLAMPTATSARSIPVKMLEENRRVINAHQTTVSGPRISFTHLIAWGIVRALERHPAMNVAYLERDGQPHVVRRERVQLGLAIDVERDGERILLVPNIKDAASLSFPALVAAYDDLVARARQNKLTVEDFERTTITLTNPGMLGTALSVPRLMKGQGVIIGTGTIGYPAEYSGMAREMTSALGISKTMTVTSTYDHRVIQGAESGGFLFTLERLLRGEQGFYERLFADLGVPQEPFEYAGDTNPIAFGGAGSDEAIAKQAGVLQLIRAYRVRGHLWADLDPLHYRPEPTPELEMSTYGLTVWDLDREFIAGGLGGNHGKLPLREILETLQRTYCWHVGVEYMHIQDTDNRQWLQERMESQERSEPLDRETQIRILERLNVAEAFETFLHTNYVGQKRFSLEGCETLIPVLDALLDDAAASGIDEVVMGMAHRGRLNVLAHVVGKPYGEIFREFEGIDPLSTHGSGDVKYHLGARGVYTTSDGQRIPIELASNPSHLEAVDPVVQGMARARQDKLADREHGRVLPVLIHGDASFAGQGVVAETLNASQLSGYRTGGTVHVIVNNQIGFTTGPADARSSTYPTDVAKMIRAPIFHVNGDYPEDAVRVIRLALAFRQRFKRDVVVDLFCYRRWGHNEADDPSYTHPILYSRIKDHRSVRKLFTERLIRRGDLDADQAERALGHFRSQLQQVHDDVRAAERGSENAAAEHPPAPEPVAEPGDTSVERTTLERVLDGMLATPPGFHLHPKLERQLAKRRQRFGQDRIDWALAESLAFGSLVLGGVPVRLSGEDSIRGTFSQRHTALFDFETGDRWVPLAHLGAGQAAFAAHDSQLSEFAVMGFEYGYSVNYPEALVLWEAQFGDFVNGAQVIIDQFLVSAESKWNQRSALVLLLPHGYEGQGPEHSSARLERFLQLAAEDNIRVAYPTTPAQYFHLLRRQALDARRKPLVVMTPKSLLRLPECVSPVERLTSGRFDSVLEDPRCASPEAIDRLIVCSGKIYYDLDAFRREHDSPGTALLRIERLYPFPEQRLRQLIGGHAALREVVWAQEEPRNMGLWEFVRTRLEPLLPSAVGLSYVGRPAGASPATGSSRRHAAQQQRLVREAIGASADRRSAAETGKV